LVNSIYSQDSQGAKVSTANVGSIYKMSENIKCRIPHSGFVYFCISCNFFYKNRPKMSMDDTENLDVRGLHGKLD